MDLNYHLHTAKIWAAYKIGKFNYKPVDLCALCDSQNLSPEVRTWHRSIPVNLVKCNQCGFVFQSPRMDQASRTLFYEKYFRPGKRSEDHAEKMFDRGKRRGKEFIDYLTSKGIQIERNSLVAEIGCGYGGALFPFKELGCSVYGSDLDEGAFGPGRREGLDLEKGEGLGKKKPNFILLSHLIEHLDDPRGFVQSLKRKAAPYCVFLAEVPNYFPENLDCFQIGHLSYFTPESFKRLFEEAGFSVVDLGLVGKRGQIENTAIRLVAKAVASV